MNVYDTLQELILARGPVGQEDEVRTVCKKHMEGLVDDISTDPAGNLIGIKKGAGKAPALRIMVHMDEISLIVKRIDKGGKLRVLPMGGIYPFTFGQGPMEIMGDSETILGILSHGPMHSSKETPHVMRTRAKEDAGLGQTVEWDDVYILTQKTEEELEQAGIHPGTRVVISQTRRILHRMGDYIAGYYMDNRAAIAIALNGLSKLKKEGKQPAGDVYVVCSTAEEIGGVGACYAARSLPGEITLAIDVGPVADEYKTELNSSPIIVYKDGRCVYDIDICRQLLATGMQMGVDPITAVWEKYGSDASISKSYGQSPRSALLCFPTENTHGYEVIHRHSLESCAQLLGGYLLAYK